MALALELIDPNGQYEPAICHHTYSAVSVFYLQLCNKIGDCPQSSLQVE